MSEMGAEGLAEVVSIDRVRDLPAVCARLAELGVRVTPAGDIPSVPGLVTATFAHTSGEVYNLKLKSESKPIGVTRTHPIWSDDQHDWVAVANLKPGERVRTGTGVTIVESITKRQEPEPVYNLEVDGDHVYRVGESEVLVHNASMGQVFSDALQNCCRNDNALGFPKCGAGALGPFDRPSQVTAAFEKEVKNLIEKFCTTVPGLKVERVEYIESLTTATTIQAHNHVSKPGDGIQSTHNVSLKAKFCCGENDLWVEFDRPHWGTRKPRANPLTYPGCPDKLH